MKALAILLNVFFPGIGTFLTGKFIQAILQLVVVFFSFGFWMTGVLGFIGAFLWIVAWVWALITAASWTPLSEHVAPQSGIGR